MQLKIKLKIQCGTEDYYYKVALWKKDLEHMILDIVYTCPGDIGTIFCLFMIWRHHSWPQHRKQFILTSFLLCVVRMCECVCGHAEVCVPTPLCFCPCAGFVEVTLKQEPVSQKPGWVKGWAEHESCVAEMTPCSPCREAMASWAFVMCSMKVNSKQWVTVWETWGKNWGVSCDYCFSYWLLFTRDDIHSCVIHIQGLCPRKRSVVQSVNAKIIVLYFIENIDINHSQLENK